MLGKNFRLRNSSAFIATYKQHRVVSNEYFTLYGGRLKDKDCEYPTKLGFVVSKKIHKRAVKRNRIKRLMRESCRVGIKNGEIGKYNNFVSLVFVAKEKALEADFQKTQKSIYGLMAKLTKKNI